MDLGTHGAVGGQTVSQDPGEQLVEAVDAPLGGGAPVSRLPRHRDRIEHDLQLRPDVDGQEPGDVPPVLQRVQRQVRLVRAGDPRLVQLLGMEDGPQPVDQRLDPRRRVQQRHGDQV
ncbi:hypothetical protein [Aeromicrobium senzhongii]|uniref:hypothetical protein n=1 Tax=Aeromicrobium sp. 636 TaxID=2678500 RepID=UPI001CA8DEB7